MKLCTDNLKQELQNLIIAHKCRVTPEMKQKNDDHTEIFEMLSRQQANSYSVFDLNENRYSFHRSAHERWLHLPVINTEVNHNHQQIYEQTHPADLHQVLENELMALNMLQKLPPDDKKDFLFTYTRRLKDKKQGYQLYMHWVSVLQCDESGEPWLLLVISERLPECWSTKNKLSTLYHIFPTVHSYCGKPETALTNYRLTEQELKILRLVYDGYNQHHIAGHLINKIKYTIFKQV